MAQLLTVPTMNTDLLNIIFGIKIRQARTESHLSLSEFATACDLSPSYITEIEKGRKYPKPDKIIKMAEVLGKSYDELASTKMEANLTSLETMLASHLLQEFPFDFFGLEINSLVTLFTRAPKRASALARTIIEIGQQYDLKGEHFLRAALRAYQEIHDSYFETLEEEAQKFMQQHQLETEFPLTPLTLQNIISQEFGYELDTAQLATHPALSSYRSVYIEGKKPKLLLNAALRASQLKFLLARELGYQYLKLEERANTSAPDKVNSFQQVLNDFKASYFAGALLMPQNNIVTDMRQFFQLKAWQPSYLLELLGKYDVTPEMLLYRFSELAPKFFDLKPHFIRFNNAEGDYQLIKQLNLNKLLLPSGTMLDEHHCRRWLGVRLLRDLNASKNQADFNETPLVGIQNSQFLASSEQRLTFGFARPLALTPHIGSSVTIGLQVTPTLKETVRFLDDPAIPTWIINETCERCSLNWGECKERAAEATLYHANQRQAEREAALNELVIRLQSQG